MIIITKIETIETDKDYATIQHLAHSHEKYIPFKDQIIDTSVVREYIQGRRFVDTRRKLDIVMGISDEAGKMFGLMHDSFTNLENDRECWRKSSEHWKKACLGVASEINKIKSYGFLERLKCLFLGIK